jgi:hypothetical protein
MGVLAVRRIALCAALAAALWMPAAASANSPSRPVAATVGAAHPALAAFHSFHFGGSRSRGYGFGRSRPGHSLLRRVVKTAIWLYILHLFFSHGGLSILLWLAIIGLVVHLVRRRRRQRDRYAY